VFFVWENPRCLHYALSKMKLQPPDFEWVAQVSLLRPAVPTGMLALILEQQDEQFRGMQTMDAWSFVPSPGKLYRTT
jgi:hypothetical protein